MNRKASGQRPIALQPVPSKTIATMLRSRLQEFVDRCVEGCPQYAYVRGRSTADAIAVVSAREAVQAQKLTLQSRYQGCTQLPCTGGGQLALDFSRAFDGVPRAQLHKALLWASVPPPLVTALMGWHEQSVYEFGDLDQGEGRTFALRPHVGLNRVAS